MPLTPCATYRPDIADYEGSSTRNILNVYPRADGYGPFGSFSAFTKSLPGCRGAFYAVNGDGTVSVFAGTATQLFQLNNTDFTWTNVSIGAGSYSSLSQDAQWQFVQTGNLVFATQANAVLQVFTLNSSTAFSNALGSPPQAAYMSVIGGFIMLSGLLGNPFQIAWSDLENFNSATSWTFGLGQADFQSFPDGGLVRGVAGGDQTGVIFQDQMCRSIAFVGPPLIFQISKISEGLGLFAPYSQVSSNGYTFFYSGQGFHVIPPGGIPTPIGREKVDRTFIAALDTGSLQLFMGAADPQNQRVYWAYKSLSGPAGAYDSILGYDRLVDQFFPISMQGEFLLGLSQTGVTLASLDAIAPTPLHVTAIADNGSGLIRLTLNTESNANFSILGQNNIDVYDVTGTSAGTANDANGTWDFIVINPTQIDLVGSSFSSGDTYSGGQIGGSLAAMTLSLDDYPTALEPQLAQFDNTGLLGFFTGPNLPATVDSAEQGAGDQRLTIRGFRPITDAQTATGQLVYRDTQQATPIVGVPVGLSTRTGRCDMMRDARYARFRVNIPAGTAWTFLAGVEPDAMAGSTI